MPEYIFSEDTVKQGYNAIFLCGVKYNMKDPYDKRNILKEHLKKINSENKIIILEENFQFSNKSNKYLSYDAIFMNNLKDVETLTAVFSDKVIIIHESISTAAEFGMFASNELLDGKICILVPDQYSVEEDKITAFLELAFFRKSNSIKKIMFYPSVKEWKVSKFKSDFRTGFYDNQIGINLSNEIEKFLNKDKRENLQIKFKKAIYHKHSTSEDTVSYMVDKKEDDIIAQVQIPVTIIKTHIISFFYLEDFRKEIRSFKTLSDHVTYIEKYYKEILLNTLSEKEAKILKKLQIRCKEPNLQFRKVIAYTLYLLQSMSMLYIIREERNGKTYTKVSITNDFKKVYELYSSLIKEKISIILGDQVNEKM